MNTAIMIGQFVLYALGGAVLALHGIAPLTKSTKDDKVLAVLEKVEWALRKVVPMPTPKVAKEAVAPAK